MERFLSQCANYIYNKHKSELHNVCLVFPNRRAGVFFNAYLRREIEKSVIAPEITTIGGLVQSNSDLTEPEKLQLLVSLFDVYRKHVGTSETFDEFFFWGDMLLADFNDIDNYLVNAKDLFRNISDLKEIETIFDYLTPEQKVAIDHYWGTVLTDNKKEFQKNYLKIWGKLFAVYEDFRIGLKSKGLGYSGMINRGMVEKLDDQNPQFAFNTYYFIGLNALTNCEKLLMKHFQKFNKACFLWDFDNFYLNDQAHEAGRFLRDNMIKFPPPADFSFESDFFQETKNIRLVAVSSNYGQAQQIPVFLNDCDVSISHDFDKTAVVLADESLLFPALGAVPPESGMVNITMGYPVKNSVVYGFTLLLINLLRNRRSDQKRGIYAYYRFVTDILNHQLLAIWEPEKTKALLNEIQNFNKISVSLKDIDFSPVHRLIFTLPDKVELYPDYFMNILSEIYRGYQNAEPENRLLLEVLFSVYNSVQKLGQVVKKLSLENNFTLGDKVFFRLFAQYVGAESVAFEGEPLKGLQVMGILETRCLDFENLIILGLNENKWPRTFTAPSFIPSNIRRGFGLPGIEEQDAMYSYYFYRLVQRAENVTATYNVTKEGISTGELSRFGHQLLYDSPHNPVKSTLDFPFANKPVQPIKIQGSTEIAEGLLKKNSQHALSPSAINAYLQCSLRFYFNYVMELPEPEEVKEEIDGAIFGNIFHESMEELYKPFEGKVIQKADIEKIMSDLQSLEKLIFRKTAKNYFKISEEKADQMFLEGKTLLIFENLKTYLPQTLKVDSQYAPFSIVSLEQKFKSDIDVEIDGVEKKINVGGKIDRIDMKDGVFRVVDYKTGYVTGTSFTGISELFEKDKENPKKEILQALIYTWLAAAGLNTNKVAPAIYDLKKLFSDKFNPGITNNKREFSFDELTGEFETNLKLLLGEIFSATNCFQQTSHLKACSYCPYNKICQKYIVN